jgi:hypothetical protein
VFLGKGERKSSSPRQTFLKSARENKTIPNAVEKELDTKFGNSPGTLVRNNVKYFALRSKNSKSNQLFLGTAAELANQDYMIAPNWNSAGAPHRFDADHLHEMQLGGDDSYDNLWLLDMSANRSSGSIIHSRFQKEVEGLISAADRKGKSKKLPPEQQTFWQKGQGGNKPDFDSVRANWRIEFKTLTATGVNGEIETRWTRPQLEKAQHLNQLEQLSHKQMVAMGLSLEPGVQPKTMLIFPSMLRGSPSPPRPRPRRAKGKKVPQTSR